MVTGSFFETVPQGGDLYVLSNVLADWDDERALQLLDNCREAMGSHARLLVIEPMFGERVQERQGASLLDLWMMIHPGGMRSVEEVRDLIGTAGLDVREVICTSSGAATLVEAERR